MRKPMVHLASYETCDKQTERKAKCPENKVSSRNITDTAGDTLKLEGFDNHLHFKTKTEISAIHMDQRKVS